MIIAENVVDAWKNKDNWRALFDQLSPLEKNEALLQLCHICPVGDAEFMLRSGADAHSREDRFVESALKGSNMPVARKLFEETRIIPWSMLASEVERVYWQQSIPNAQLVQFMLEACGGVKPVHGYMARYVENDAEPAVPLKAVWAVWNGLLEHLSPLEVDTLEQLAKKDHMTEHVPLFVARGSKKELLAKVDMPDNQPKTRKF